MNVQTFHSVSFETVLFAVKNMADTVACRVEHITAYTTAISAPETNGKKASVTIVVGELSENRRIVVSCEMLTAQSGEGSQVSTIHISNLDNWADYLEERFEDIAPRELREAAETEFELSEAFVSVHNTMLIDALKDNCGETKAAKDLADYTEEMVGPNWHKSARLYNGHRNSLAKQKFSDLSNSGKELYTFNYRLAVWLEYWDGNPGRVKERTKNLLTTMNNHVLNAKEGKEND